MGRSVIRELAFKILFQVDVGKNPGERVLADTLKAEALAPQLQTFLQDLVKGTLAKQAEIDQGIAGYAKEWKLERMASTERNVLRLAFYEMLYSETAPPGVIINEAVELAKRYGDVDSGKFVNGILGSLVREKGIEVQTTDQSSLTEVESE